jgi:cell division protein FtsI (penicillin-binding protein 3)
MGRRGFLVKIISITAIMVLIFIFLGIHLYFLQIEQHDEYYNKARKKYTAIKRIKGTRGEIYDSLGNLFVGNAPSVDLRADPNLVGNEFECKRVARFFAVKLGVPYSKLYERLAKKEVNGKEIHEIVIKNEVSLDSANSLKNEIKSKNIKGVFFFDSVKRYYPKDQMLSNILGFVNADDIDIVPVSGLESAYNSVLSPGKPNLSVYERARDGIPLAYGNNRIGDEKRGGNLYLTIQEPIQAIVEDELNAIVEKWHPKIAYAVMVDPKTGSILAIGQRPTFNPNDRSTLNGNDWQNKIVTEGFEPGSSMKSLVVAKALDLGVVNPNTVINCENGVWFYAGKSLKDTHRYGLLTVSGIIQKSSNIGTAKIAVAMGKDNLYNLFVKYGFGQESGLPFQPEATGILRKYNKWDALSITRFPIGQGILTTALQMMSAYTALANNGERMKLRIIDKIEDPETEYVYTFPIKSGGRIFGPNAAKEIVEMMKKVTEEGGTATKASVPGYYVAGKTGTGQKWVDGGYSHSKFVGNFIGFVPADDPAFLLLVAVDEPKGAYYGATVAAPHFRNIAEKTLRYLDIPPSYEVDTTKIKR